MSIALGDVERAVSPAWIICTNRS
ncbi:MAG: hypothetical protein RLZZ408_1769, partial [Verrucomicrobiota bacterium]